MAIHNQTDLDYLIDDLRLHLGDLTTPYTFEDTTLRHALVMACKILAKRWRNRYKLDSDYAVTRNSSGDFAESSPPVIEYADEAAFILQAAILLKSAELRDSVWDIQSWKDDEVSYSNIQAGRSAGDLIGQDKALLEEWFKKRLFGSDRQSLSGFHLPYNQREGYK